MNKEFMLQNYIESSNNFNFNEPKPKKSSRINTQDLELQIGIVFNQICQVLEDHQVSIPGQQALKTNEKLSKIKQIVEMLLSRSSSKNQNVNESNIINCPDCQTYEANLQKLQNQVRQHIRIEQQLKIYQDTQQEKIDEHKKERKQIDKKIQNYKKQAEEFKKEASQANQKITKLQNENQHIKKELRDIKRTLGNHSASSSHVPQQAPHTKRDHHRQSAYAYESKQNKIDWVHRNISVKKDQKERTGQRKSMEKRNESAEKNWRMSNNAKSNKMISVMNQKLLQEKTRDQRKKVIQSKFDYRR